MGNYVYQNKTLHLNRRRTQGNGTPLSSGSQETSYDRRRPKIRDGIILVDFDRRKKDDPKYSGPERRSGVDRRSGRDRRQSGVVLKDERPTSNIERPTLNNDVAPLTIIIVEQWVFG